MLIKTYLYVGEFSSTYRKLIYIQDTFKYLYPSTYIKLSISRSLSANLLFHGENIYLKELDVVESYLLTYMFFSKM